MKEKYFKDKNIIIFGMGVSGKGAAKLMAACGAHVTLYDSNEKLDLKALAGELGLCADTRYLQGKLSKEDFAGADMLVISPGVPLDIPEIKQAKECGVKIIGETEAAYLASEGRLAAITGTNGKTTTTTLTGEIMKAAYGESRVFVAGNIGSSYALAAMNTSEDSVTVAEISSFQLESAELFHPNVSAILNITPDHLNRHGTMENYARCKLKIAARQEKGEKCIVNYDDAYLRELSKELSCDVFYFSRKEKLGRGIYVDGEDIMLADGDGPLKITEKSSMLLLGAHNLENVLAAIGTAYFMGAEPSVIADVIRTFKAVEHRIEFVCEKGGVKYYNDSKGTNTDAAAKAIESMPSPCVLIAGGYDKGADFTDWIKGFNGKVKAMVLMGETAGKIRDAAKEQGFGALYGAKDMKEAVSTASELAAGGECVLLSPACASWDQYKSYEERGRIFKDCVRQVVLPS